MPRRGHLSVPTVPTLSGGYYSRARLPRLFKRLSVQRFVKAPRPRGELVSLLAAAVSTA